MCRHPIVNPLTWHVGIRSCCLILAAIATSAAMGGVVERYPWLAIAMASSLACTAGLFLLVSKTTKGFAPVSILLVLVMATSSVVFFEPAPFDVLVVLFSVGWLLISKINIVRVPVTGVFFFVSGLGILFQAVSLTLESSSPRFVIITLYVLILSIISFVLASSYPVLLRSAFRGYVAGATITTALAIAIVELTIPFPVDVTYYGLRLQGFFKDPNVLSPFLVSAFMIAFASPFAKAVMPLSPRWISRYVAMLVAIAGILLAYSRGGWVALAVTVAVYLATLLVARRGIQVSTLLTIVVIVGILVIWVPRIQLDPDSFLVQRAQIQSYDATRFSVQEDALDGFRDAPIVGHGPGSADLLLRQSTHNLYLRVLFENGMLGVISLGVLILGSVWHSFRFTLRATSRESQRYGALLFSVLIGSLALGFVIDTVHWRHMWIFVGLGWACASYRNGTVEA